MGCGGRSNQNCTYFTAAATANTQSGACTLKVCPCNSNICQVGAIESPRLNGSTQIIIFCSFDSTLSTLPSLVHRQTRLRRSRSWMAKSCPWLPRVPPLPLNAWQTHSRWPVIKAVLHQLFVASTLENIVRPSNQKWCWSSMYKSLWQCMWMPAQLVTIWHFNLAPLELELMPLPPEVGTSRLDFGHRLWTIVTLFPFIRSPNTRVIITT